MLTSEINLKTVTFPRGGLYKRTSTNMSRRQAKRILYFLIFGGVSALFYFVFFSARVPAKEGWAGAVQNMQQIHDHIQEEDNRDNINVQVTGQEDMYTDEQDLNNNLMASHPRDDVKDIFAADEDIVQEDNRVEDYVRDGTSNTQINAVKGDETEYHANDDLIATESERDGRVEHDNENVYEDGKVEVNENEYNTYKNRIVQNALNNDYRNYKQNFSLPPEYIIRNRQGEFIGVKLLENGLEDLINMKRFNKNTGDTNRNKFPLNKDGLAHDIGQGIFNPDQQEAMPFRQNIIAKVDSNNEQAGARRQLQQGGFNQPAQNLIGRNNNFRPRIYLDNKQAGQNMLDKINVNPIKDNFVMKTFDDYLKARRPQKDQLFNGPGNPRGRFEQRENNRIEDNLAGNMNRGFQNDRFGLEKEPQGNMNAGIFDNNVNDLDALRQLNPMLPANNEVPQTTNPVPQPNDILHNLNPLIPVGNKVNLKNQEEARQNNRFNAGREILENPDVSLSHLQGVQQYPQNQSVLIDNLQVNSGFPGLNQQEQNAEKQDAANKIGEPLQQRPIIQDLTAPVSVQANCIDFRFPTGSGPLCIHSRDKDTEVSAKIEATGAYEEDTMNQILLMLSTDLRLGFTDIGAGLGEFTIGVALMMRKVLAVEPLKVNCDLLHKNAIENHVSDKIVLVPQALSNESYTGLAITSDAAGGYGGAQVSRLTSYIDPRNLPPGANIVQVTTLDNLAQVAPFNRTVMKLDVGGEMEADILGGSSKFFKAIQVPYIITHWSVSKTLHRHSETLGQLVKLGYVPRQTWNGPNVAMDSLGTDHSFLVWTKI